MYIDLSEVFGRVCSVVHEKKAQCWQQELASLAEDVQPHSIDTHPPLSARLSGLGVELADIPLEALAPPTSV
jgi:hypothetical protein